MRCFLKKFNNSGKCTDWPVVFEPCLKGRQGLLQVQQEGL